VQHNELYYDDNFESFKVVVLPFPLVGKVSLDYYKSVTNTGVLATPVEKRTLEEHREVIERLIGAGTAGFNPAQFATATTVTASGSPLLPYDIAVQGIHRFVTTFNSSYVIVKGFIAHAGTKVAAVPLSRQALNSYLLGSRDVRAHPRRGGGQAEK
jgi:hypothetical protein